MHLVFRFFSYASHHKSSKIPAKPIHETKHQKYRMIQTRKMKRRKMKRRKKSNEKLCTDIYISGAKSENIFWMKLTKKNCLPEQEGINKNKLELAFLCHFFYVLAV